MSLGININRALIAIHAYCRGKRKNKESINRNTVIIVFQQIFGDAIVIQNSINEYVKIFPKTKGYNVILLAKPSVISFMRETINISTDIEFEAVDFKKFLENYKYYNRIVKQYEKRAEILIVPGTSLSAEIFAASNDANRKIGLVRSSDVFRPKIMAVFGKIAYTEKIRPKKEDMMLQRHRLLINYLGLKEYQAKLPNLLPKRKIIMDTNYCVLCPGSSKMEKCWPIDRYSEIADFIIENYNMKVYLCGGQDEIEFENMILSHVKNSNRVISYIGKTSFSEWSAIVQHASLVVGNDSATMHLAAASRRKAICIAGVYDKFQFFPYKVDTLDAGDILPVTLIKNMPCEWCRTKGYEAGYGNLECRNRIKKNMCALCIEEITVENVKEQIIKLMGESDK